MDDPTGTDDDLFTERLIERGERPPNRGRLDGADHDADGDNPLCGDTIHVWVRMGPDGRVADASFEGAGCVISQAGASLVLEHARGRTPDEVAAMDRTTVFDLLGIQVTTSRVKCAVLGLATLKEALARPRATP